MLKQEQENFFDPASLKYLQSLMRSRTGLLLLDPDIESYEDRIIPFIRENGFQNLRELVRALENGRAGLAQKLIDVLNHREPLFFRDAPLFQMLEETLLLPLLARKHKGAAVRFWSVGCSTGEEAYSLAIFMQEKFKDILEQASLEIFATDLSSDAIDIAKLGLYPEEKIEPYVSTDILSKYFKQVNGSDWQVSNDIRHLIKFQVHNLLMPCDGMTLFDIIFCRNVLPLYDGQIKARILDAFASRLRRNGLLILGQHETLLGSSNKFEIMKECRAVYKTL